MTKTITIRREDLKTKNFKAAAVKKSGDAPTERSLDPLVAVLKKALAV